MSDTTDYSTWPTEEPPVGWEQFARNWMDTARQDAINADYWRRQTDQARRELDELRSAARAVVEEFCDEVFSPTQAMKRLSALVAPSVPESQEESKP